MVADESGRVARPKIGMKPSGQWLITGAVRYNNYGHIVERFTLTDLFNSSVTSWQYKNGKQRVFLCDLDHGSPRTWMNPTHSVSVLDGQAATDYMTRVWYGKATA
jgi:hypothetical protein